MGKIRKTIDTFQVSNVDYKVGQRWFNSTTLLNVLSEAFLDNSFDKEVAFATITDYGVIELVGEEMVEDENGVLIGQNFHFVSDGKIYNVKYRIYTFYFNNVNIKYTLDETAQYFEGYSAFKNAQGEIIYLSIPFPGYANGKNYNGVFYINENGNLRASGGGNIVLYIESIAPANGIVSLDDMTQAENISYDNEYSRLNSRNVQGAIDELDKEKADVYDNNIIFYQEEIEISGTAAEVRYGKNIYNVKTSTNVAIACNGYTTSGNVSTVYINISCYDLEGNRTLSTSAFTNGRVRVITIPEGTIRLYVLIGVIGESGVEKSATISNFGIYYGEDAYSKQKLDEKVNITATVYNSEFISANNVLQHFEKENITGTFAGYEKIISKIFYVGKDKEILPNETYSIYIKRKENLGAAINIFFRKIDATSAQSPVYNAAGGATFETYYTFTTPSELNELEIALTNNSSSSVEYNNGSIEFYLIKGSKLNKTKLVGVIPEEKSVSPKETDFIADYVLFKSNEVYVDTVNQWSYGFDVVSGENIGFKCSGRTGTTYQYPFRVWFNDINGNLIKDIYPRFAGSTGERTLWLRNEIYTTAAPENAARCYIGFYKTSSDASAIYKDVSIFKGAKPYELSNDISLPINYQHYDIPQLFLEGDISAMSKDNAVSLTFKYIDKEKNERTGTAEVKWQGSSSLAYQKKNYTVKFDTAFEAKEGWGEQKKYCMKANWIDYTHSRNIVSARLWAKITKDWNNSLVSNNITELTSCPNYGAIDGFPVVIIINGEYMGLYTFNIPKDGWMMNMGSGNQEAIIGASGAGTGPLWQTRPVVGTDLEIEYATDENDIQWLQDKVDAIYNAMLQVDSAETLETLLGPLIDLNSVRRYYCFSVAIGNYDGFHKNVLYGTYGGKLFVSAYDMDSTFGLSTNGKMDQILFGPRTKTGIDNMLFKTVMTYLTDEQYKELMLELISTKNRRQDRNALMKRFSIAKEFLSFGMDIPRYLLNKENEVWSAYPSSSVNNVSTILDIYNMRVEMLEDDLS